MAKRLVFLLVMGLMAMAMAWAQASSSTVRGTVHDPAGAVVPNAKVELTNTATNVMRGTTSNDSGLYVFPGVIPGPYKLTAETPGMQKYEATLTVLVQQDAAVDIT